MRREKEERKTVKRFELKIKRVCICKFVLFYYLIVLYKVVTTVFNLIFALPLCTCSLAY